jgi:hypothetical protein
MPSPESEPGPSPERILAGIRDAFAGACVCQPDLAHFDTQIWPPC